MKLVFTVMQMILGRIFPSDQIKSQKQLSATWETVLSYGTLSVSDAETLVHAYMTSILDYCYALLGGYPSSAIQRNNWTPVSERWILSFCVNMLNLGVKYP